MLFETRAYRKMSRLFHPPAPSEIMPLVHALASIENVKVVWTVRKLTYLPGQDKLWFIACAKCLKALDIDMDRKFWCSVCQGHPVMLWWSLKILVMLMIPFLGETTIISMGIDYVLNKHMVDEVHHHMTALTVIVVGEVMVEFQGVLTFAFWSLASRHLLHGKISRPDIFLYPEITIDFSQVFRDRHVKTVSPTHRQMDCGIQREEKFLIDVQASPPQIEITISPEREDIKVVVAASEHKSVVSTQSNTQEGEKNASEREKHAPPRKENNNSQEPNKDSLSTAANNSGTPAGNGSAEKRSEPKAPDTPQKRPELQVYED